MEPMKDQNMGAAISNLTLPDEVTNIKNSLTELHQEWLCGECASGREARAITIIHYNTLMGILSAIENGSKEKN